MVRIYNSHWCEPAFTSSLSLTSVRRLTLLHQSNYTGGLPCCTKHLHWRASVYINVMFFVCFLEKGTFSTFYSCCDTQDSEQTCSISRVLYSTYIINISRVLYSIYMINVKNSLFRRHHNICFYKFKKDCSILYLTKFQKFEIEYIGCSIVTLCEISP